jgi:uncharacterized protein (TIGR01244 family)
VDHGAEPSGRTGVSDFRAVTPRLSVSPQIEVAEVARAKAEGFALIINNRPDGETVGQPLGGGIAAQARAQGLDYVHIPVSGPPTAEQIDAMARAVAGAPGPVLAFCRSGTRSINTWAAGQLAAGLMDEDEIVALGAAAGYDLTAVARAFGRGRATG